jgi:2-phospho-L-lactate guanylyltransferase
MASNRGRWAMMPVKGFDWAKSRLEAVLSLDQRQVLAKELMRNSLAALIDSACFECVIVVSRDDAVLAFAAQQGAEPMREAGPPDLNDALRAVRDVAIAASADSLLVLFSDLPLVGGEDVRALVRASEQSAVVIGPDRRSEGTNALLLTPPDAIDFAFGQGSFEKHLTAAAKAGRDAIVLQLTGIGFDIDFPSDLEDLQALGWTPPWQRQSEGVSQSP